MRFLVTILLVTAALAAAAQQSVPVEKLGRERAQAVQRGQFQAGQAYRELEEARYQSKLAEQDVLNLEDAHLRSSRETAELKRQLDAAKKAFSEAQAKEAAARKAYEKAVQDVDAARRAPP